MHLSRPVLSLLDAASEAHSASYKGHCDLANNTGSLVNYGERYCSKFPVSTSRAEGCVDEIANARVAKNQRMTLPPQGAHRMAVVRAAVLNGRLSQKTGHLLAA